MQKMLKNRDYTWGENPSMKLLSQGAYSSCLNINNKRNYDLTLHSRNEAEPTPFPYEEQEMLLC